MVDLHFTTTPDGRQLEYAVSGPVDARVLLLQVGTPNAAQIFRAIAEPAAQLGLRTVSYSRPGYGSSTAKPGRSVADVGADVVVIADAVGVDDFITLGWSGGGPHALATAALLPNRCRGATLLASVAPYPASGLDYLSGMDESNVCEFTAAFAGLDVLTAELEPMAATFSDLTGEHVSGSLHGLLSEVDRAALTGEFADEMADALRRSVASGIAGWRDDDLAFVKDWGFDLQQIEVPVAVWQGAHDRMVPFDHGRWLAENVPNARPHLLDEHGHISLVQNAADIIADLVAHQS
jgi:pimeloyl-ACP methyl ester carboxylesterase